MASESPTSPPRTLLANLRTGDWLAQQDFPPLAWVVPELVPEGMTLLVGGPKIGKSWLSLDVALAVARGGNALGTVEVGPPQPVLLLALEDGDRRLQDRCRTLMPVRSIPAALHYMTRIEPGMVVQTIRKWLEDIHPEANPLVILDTLGRVMPPATQGESPYQRDYRVAGWLKRICDERPGMGLVVLHHDRKAQSDDFVDGVSGTNGIAGAADTIIVIARSRNENSGLLKVTGRDVVEREYAVTVEQGSWRLAGQDFDAAAGAAATIRASANLGDRSAEIIQFVAGHPEGVRIADVADAVDVSPNEASAYLGRLVHANRLCRPQRGLYAPVGSVGSVGLSDADPGTSNTYNASNRSASGADQ